MVALDRPRRCRMESPSSREMLNRTASGPSPAGKRAHDSARIPEIAERPEGGVVGLREGVRRWRGKRPTRNLPAAAWRRARRPRDAQRLDADRNRGRTFRRYSSTSDEQLPFGSTEGAWWTQNPADSFLRYGLAMEYQNAGDLEAAVREFRALMEANPDYSAGLFSRRPDAGAARAAGRGAGDV